MGRGRRKPKAEPAVVRFGVSIPRELFDKFDQQLTSRGHENRSAALRELMREKLAEQDWAAGEGRQAAILSFVLDSAKLEAQRRVLDWQREVDSLVLSALHVRLDPRQELWVLVLSGTGAELRQQAERVLGAKGVALGKLVLAGRVGG
jgi:CopG family nickel-responsive transcriptional regulator